MLFLRHGNVGRQPSGYVIVGAQTNDELVFGEQALSSAGGVDVVIARTPP